jgi:glutathione S-transferase
MSYVLRHAAGSPFVRKVRIAADLLGLIDKIELRPGSEADPVSAQNPLGKIPVLIPQNGQPIYDSSVIVEYLDAEAGGGKVIPKSGAARWQALTDAALADGILEAAILIVYEGRYRPDQTPYEPWLAFQRGKIERSLDVLAKNPPQIGTPVTVGAIAVACALGYVDFRKQVDWRARTPALIAWLDKFRAAVPAFDKTKPEG